MRRPIVAPIATIVALALGAACARAAEPFTPAPAERVPGYSAAELPCRIDRDAPPSQRVQCKGDVLQNQSLRQLSILRNTIYARYGWDGYRKQWLRDYFHGQPWFKANSKFSYKALTPADRKNAHYIATREQSFTDVQLKRMRDDIFARHGKPFTDKPDWTTADGKRVKSCQRPKGGSPEMEGDELKAFVDGYGACYYPRQAWYKPDPRFTPDALSGDERIELGLISRALGDFALDDDAREKHAASLDHLLPLDDLRQLSLRDLRLLRNTIYARRGRQFKSEILRDHFQGMSWYKPNPDYSDKLLSATDSRNIGLIRTVENELGGPLSDEDWLQEPATDGA